MSTLEAKSWWVISSENGTHCFANFWKIGHAEHFSSLSYDLVKEQVKVRSHLMEGVETFGVAKVQLVHHLERTLEYSGELNARYSTFQKIALPDC